MDKVTHVFNTTTSVSSPTSSSSSSSSISTADTRPTNPNMGNANNKEGGEAFPMSSGSGDTRSLSTRDLKGKDRRTSTPELSSTSQGSSVTGLGTGVDSLNTSSSPSSAINIPKGKNTFLLFLNTKRLGLVRCIHLWKCMIPSQTTLILQCDMSWDYKTN